MSHRSGTAAAMALAVSGLCLAVAGSVCDDVPSSTVSGGNVVNGSDGLRGKRFVVVNGDGVPDYGGTSNDYDDWYDDEVYEHDHGHGHGGGGGVGGGGDHDHDHGDDDDDDDDDGYFYHHGDGPGYHHVWWHHFYHHGEPHLPFPLFPPIFIHRRPVHRGCSDWPFVCRSSYEVVQWLQCYHEFVHGEHGLSPVHAWRK